MLKQFRPAIAMLGLMTLITGVAYPLLVTTVAQVVFPEQANGSLLRNEQGQVVGSALLAQNFEGARWFQPRPSAAGFATVASGASNLAQSNPALAERIAQDAQRLLGEGSAPVPLELVTTSASGLDPHLTPAAARWQVARIAAARQLPSASLERLIEQHTERSMIGPDVVNVLALNLALADNRAFAENESTP
ncbi:potassium-transporting ATPase subunit KdpC [Pseudomonas subflava]|uniref:potassium-transporting ATPase subunit KdpC n=1 Tax=Pseudomonas subflava TaxID=2952933 RepID=UPI00207B050F|nr:potassium-transporting ATPase subunit KdpC [Pseudomonas subflava]